MTCALFLRSFAKSEMVSSVESTVCALLQQNTGVWGVPQHAKILSPLVSTAWFSLPGIVRDVLRHGRAILQPGIRYRSAFCLRERQNARPNRQGIVFLVIDGTAAAHFGRNLFQRQRQNGRAF